MTQVTFEDLLSTGAHFGHVTRKWHPNFKPFILMEKNGVHIINLEETIRNLDRALEFIRSVLKNNGEILFVGTKKQARDIVQQEADRCGMFYVVERWLGGTLTNFSTIKKSIKRLHLLEKEGSHIYENLTKKEIQKLNRERIKLADQHRGIKDMKRLPDAIVVVDARHEVTAVMEANRLGIPIVAIIDSNTDPTTIDYPIPANDDSIRTIQLIIAAIADTVLEATGKAVSEMEDVEEAETAPPTPEEPEVVAEEAVQPEAEVVESEAAVEADSNPATEESVPVEEEAVAEIEGEK